MNTDEMLDTLVRELMAENPNLAVARVPQSPMWKRELLRTLMNLRPVMPVRPDLLEMQDRILSEERDRKGVTSASALPTVSEEFPGTKTPFASRIALWRGDITTLAANAIVNAANARMLGCFTPHHHCIDNAIHSAAGMQLRQECSLIIWNQGSEEPPGRAKITSGYNLPARYVLHTVGPTIPDGVAAAISAASAVTSATSAASMIPAEDQRLLASCYSACLDLAAQTGDIHSLAFCCISTGGDHFPKELAAKIAVQAVTDWLGRNESAIERVVFDVYTREEWEIYAKIFRAGERRG
jgi:O-acetyl-ADP-ribose deacetylase (regulator of RNase III)